MNLHSRGRTLLMLFLFTDVRPTDAPTRIYVGSHMDVPPVLEPMGESGTHFKNVLPPLPDVHKREVALATGDAGDVYLCHPFLVHAATRPHRGTKPRFMAQPELPPTAPLQLKRTDADYAPTGIAVRLSLGLNGGTALARDVNRRRLLPPRYFAASAEYRFM